MDIFDKHYYKLQKRMLSLSGMWPYQASNIFILLRMIFLNGIVMFMLVPEVKYILEEVRNDWKSFGSVQSELLIIEKYAERGRKISMLYAYSIYSMAWGYYFVSYASPMLDLILPLNESRNRFLIFPADFYVGVDGHFFLFLNLEWYGLLTAVHITISLDILYMTLMVHSCGTFAVLSERLKKLRFKKFKDEKYLTIRGENSLTEEQMIYLYLMNCIKLHLKNIKFAENLNATFNTAYLFDIVFGVLVTSTSAVQFVTNTDRPNYQFKFGSLCIAQCIRIFCNSYPGQLLIDHSSYINVAALTNQWYDLPEKCKKLLFLIVMRSEKPTEFVVGKIFTMNIQNFSMIVKTCVSYCTVMLSVQDK